MNQVFHQKRLDQRNFCVVFGILFLVYGITIVGQSEYILGTIHLVLSVFLFLTGWNRGGNLIPAFAFCFFFGPLFASSVPVNQPLYIVLQIGCGIFGLILGFWADMDDAQRFRPQQIPAELKSRNYEQP